MEAGGDRGPLDEPDGVEGHGAHAPRGGGSQELRSVEEVRSAILGTVHALSPIELHLQEAYGCVLAQEVVAELDMPPFSSSGMDGFAVRATDIASASADNPV